MGCSAGRKKISEDGAAVTRCHALPQLVCPTPRLGSTGLFRLSERSSPLHPPTPTLVAKTNSAFDLYRGADKSLDRRTS